MRGAWIAALLLAAPLAHVAKGAQAVQGSQTEQVPIGATVEVPLDHEHPEMGRAPLYYELGAPYDPAKPLLLVIADGQQFYVRKGVMARLQRDEFGDAFNVAGIVGRGATQPFIDAALDAAGRPAWEKAWRVFRAEQWVEDIDAVRRAIAGADSKVLLYGVSGGALLVQQYLSRHGGQVARAFIGAPVNPFLVGELRLSSDRFWEEIGPELQKTLRAALDKHAGDRAAVIMTLQRQNFFVPPDRLPAARAELIQALAAGDTGTYEKARKDYQVEEVKSFFDSNAGIPIRVREYEFFQPSGAASRLSDGGVNPDLENQRNFAAPLLAVHEAGRIPAPVFDAAPFHRLDTELFILAGRWDHAVDYRSTFALAAGFPRRHLFMADDDHMLGRMKDDDSRQALLRAFFAFGLGSPQMTAALAAAERHRWIED